MTTTTAVDAEQLARRFLFEAHFYARVPRRDIARAWLQAAAIALDAEPLDTDQANELLDATVMKNGETMPDTAYVSLAVAALRRLP